MDEILDSPVSQNATPEFAGFWIRVGAYFLDAIILYVVQISLGYALIENYSLLTPNTGFSFFMVAIQVLYFAGMESSSRQATLGKMACGIIVQDAQGQQISFLNAFGRFFAKILSALILCIGFIMVAFSKEKQSLHDMIASTYVVYK